MSQPKDVYLVVGGSGFVGRHIVQLLLDRKDDVSVFDIVQRYHDTPFYSGDISDEEVVLSALRKACLSVARTLNFSYPVAERSYMHHPHCITTGDSQ
jgi:nucleoside-diphosphate-sugar epimerase